MKRFVIPVCISLLAAACGGSSSPSTTTAPSPAPTPTPSPTTTNTAFTVSLATGSETPSISGAETAGNGTATITFHTTKDANGNVTAATVDFQVAVSSFPSSTQFTAAHIHTGGAGVAGAVLIDTGLKSGAVALTNGAGSFSANGVNADAATVSGMLKNPGSFYFNIHTAANPGGVARGQLDNSVGSAPPPSTPPPSNGY
jgi:hypothetical protein